MNTFSGNTNLSASKMLLQARTFSGIFYPGIPFYNFSIDSFYKVVCCCSLCSLKEKDYLVSQETSNKDGVSTTWFTSGVNSNRR